MTRRHKYGVAAKADRTVDGITFDSKKEMTRWSTLQILVKNGEVSNLERQVKIPLHANGEHIGDYVCDFVYDTPDGKVWEDVKGVRTKFYLWKKKHVLAEYGIDIHET